MSGPAHQAQTRRGYDAVAEDYAALLPGLDAETRLDVAMIDDFTARCLAGPTGPVADVGCGAGRVSAYLSERGLDVRGFDLSPGMIEVARRTHPQVRFEVAAVQALPADDASFDGLLAWYSLIHTPPSELDAALDELARVLRPGGLLLTAFQAGGGERLDRHSGYGHEVAFSSYRHDPDHLSALLTTSGFMIHARLLRSAEGQEKSPQAVVLAIRNRPRGAGDGDTQGPTSGPEATPSA